ncbi:DDE endonuclease [Xenorhabdus sp. TS4]|nr:DDE endonuclease [Xenorhabdus sp. TS4]
MSISRMQQYSAKRFVIFYVTLPKKIKELSTCLTDNFQILKPAYSS